MRTEIAQEYEHVKDITNTLASFRSESRSGYNECADFESHLRDYSRHEEPTRDPDVWPPPTPIEQKFVAQVFNFSPVNINDGVRGQNIWQLQPN